MDEMNIDSNNHKYYMIKSLSLLELDIIEPDQCTLNPFVTIIFTTDYANGDSLRTIEKTRNLINPY